MTGNTLLRRRSVSQAGDADVKVEYRGGAGERFGQGQERAMKFGDFLSELERKNDLFYLTTQVRCREEACRRGAGGVVGVS